MNRALLPVLCARIRMDTKSNERPARRDGGDRRRDGLAPSRQALQAEDFSHIHREYGQRLIERMAGYIRDRQRAEDIAARAFEKAWEQRGTFRGEASARTWIESIARNEARHAWGQQRRFPTESTDRAYPRELAAPELVTDELERREDRLRLQEALRRLPTNYRRALVGHFVAGLSVREVAEREGVPFGTVLSRIAKGKELLREAWDQSGPARQVCRERLEPVTWDR